MKRRSGFRYSRWDGSQTGFDLDAQSLLDEMSDDRLEHFLTGEPVFQDFADEQHTTVAPHPLDVIFILQEQAEFSYRFKGRDHGHPPHP